MARIKREWRGKDMGTDGKGSGQRQTLQRRRRKEEKAEDFSLNGIYFMDILAILTFISSTTSFNFSSFLATTTTLAPLDASKHARLLPKP